jgi:XTP/dITP diphosphohydrolase
MKKLLFATNNAHKVAEIQAAIGNQLSVISLQDAGINTEIPEPFNTLEENAAHKAAVIHEQAGVDCFSEDTGLEIEAIGGKPGVLSARYAGPGRSDDDNINRVLQELKTVVNRKARFRTVISLIWEGRTYSFEGICNGTILEARQGSGGFGYDPIFAPDGSVKSFGEMTMNEKNQYSHRKKAADQLVLFLQQQS